MSADIKIVLSVIATIIASVSYVPYIRDIYKGKTKPHAFSWLVWAIITYIAGFAQLVGGGGYGAIVALTTATISLGIAVIAWQKHRQLINRFDWVMLLASLAVIPLWVVTKAPLLSVILVIIIDLVASLPTYRKAFKLPYSETLSTYYLSTIKHFLTIMAQQRYTLVTTLFPTALVISTLGLVGMIVLRRSQVLERAETKTNS